MLYGQKFKTAVQSKKES